MNYPLLFFMIVFFLCFGCGKVQNTKIDVDASEWEFKMISQGNNSPDFQATDDSIQFIPILLKKGYSLMEIQQYFQWSSESLAIKCNKLLTHGFIKKEQRSYLPSLMVISDEDALFMRKQISPVADEIASAIEGQLDSIIIRTKQVSCLSPFQFEDLSLLILSNVLLDNGQIRNVERLYLKSDRPKRKDKYYYAAYGEKPEIEGYEAWNVFGNQVNLSEGFAICRYGNQRYTTEVLKLNASISAQYQQQQAAEAFPYPVLDVDCRTEVLALASLFTPELIAILEQHTHLFEGLYEEMKYNKEVTYNEFFIWMYHILYSTATDRLIEKGLVKIPKEKVSFYIMQF